MASLDDILSTQKNGVVAINALAAYISNWYTLQRGNPISPSAASTSTSTLYTVPNNVQFQLQEVDIINTALSVNTFSIYLVPSGGTASSSNALFYNAPINGSTTVQWQGSLALAAGSTIQASASDVTVTFKLAGTAI
jgi:hypothetical protein